MAATYSSKIGCDRGQVEADAGQVRVAPARSARPDRPAPCRRRRTCGTFVHGNFAAIAMLAPRLRPVIASRNCSQARGVGVQRVEEAGLAVLDFVLRLAGAQRLGEIAPEADRAARWPSRECRRCRTACSGRGTGRSRACWRSGRRRGSRKPSATSVSRKSRADARMQAEPRSAGRLESPAAAGEFGEHAQLDGAEQGLGRPESQARLQDGVRGRGLRSCDRVYRRKSLRLRACAALLLSFNLRRAHSVWAVFEPLPWGCFSTSRPPAA